MTNLTNLFAAILIVYDDHFKAMVEICQGQINDLDLAPIKIKCQSFTPYK
jgi:hypothetical protein